MVMPDNINHDKWQIFYEELPIGGLLPCCLQLTIFNTYVQRRQYPWKAYFILFMCLITNHEIDNFRIEQNWRRNTV